MTTTDTPAVQAHWRQQKPRPVFWFDPGQHEHALDILIAVMAATHEPRVTVYLLAGETNDTAPPHAWYTAPLAQGWRVRYRQEQPPLRTATYTRPDCPGLEIQFRHTSAWFRSETSLSRVRAAYAALEKRLRRDWDDSHVVLLGSPAQTGLDLLARALPKDKHDTPYRYELPPPELWELLHRYAYQHRLELCTLPEIETAPGYYYLDGRFAYAAHLRNVPTWLYAHDTGVNEFSFHGWGFYHITARVPRGWSHLGIFKQPGELAWPNTPGQMVTTWADSHEIKLAIEQGWDVQVHERYLYAGASTRPGSDPLFTWGKRLIAAYSDCSRPELGSYGPLLKEAVGHLVYDTIGTFKRSATTETVYVPRGEDLPLGAAQVEVVPGGFEAKVEKPLSDYQLRWALVHWWAAITHKQRRHLMRKVFQVDREHVAAIRTDAAHLLAPPDPGIWVDTGRVGDYRVKGRIEREIAAPHEETTLFELMHEAVRP